MTAPTAAERALMERREQLLVKRYAGPGLTADERAELDRNGREVDLIDAFGRLMRVCDALRLAMDVLSDLRTLCGRCRRRVRPCWRCVALRRIERRIYDVSVGRVES